MPLKPNSLSTRFPEERVRIQAKRLAYQRLTKDLAAVESIDSMLSDFEGLDIERGLPDGAYEVFEKTNRQIATAYLELMPKLEELQTYAFDTA